MIAGEGELVFFRHVTRDGLISLQFTAKDMWEQTLCLIGLNMDDIMWEPRSRTHNGGKPVSSSNAAGKTCSPLIDE